MLDETFTNLYELKSVISKDDRFVLLSNLNEKLKKDAEVIKFSKEFKTKEDKYNFSLEHFGEESKETKKTKLEMLEAKKTLDSLPLVKEYNEALIKCNDLLREIDSLLFFDIKENIYCRGCHD